MDTHHENEETVSGQNRNAFLIFPTEYLFLRLSQMAQENDGITPL